MLRWEKKLEKRGNGCVGSFSFPAIEQALGKYENLSNIQISYVNVISGIIICEKRFSNEIANANNFKFEFLLRKHSF